MTITTTINKIEATVGEDITCSTSGTSTNYALTYWIINYTSADGGKSLEDLRDEQRVFTSYNGNRQSTVPITTNHLNIVSLTSVMLVTAYANSIETLRNTPLDEGGEGVYVMDTFTVIINPSQEPVEDLDISKYYVNITKQPVEDLDSITVEINNEYDNRFDIVSSAEFSELKDTFDIIKDNNKELVITPQIEEVMDTYRNGDEPFPYSTYAINLKKNNDVVTFEDVKNTVDDSINKLESDTDKEINYYEATLLDGYTRNCWSEVSGQGGSYSILTNRITGQSIKKFKYENLNNETVRLTVRLPIQYSNVYIHTDGAEVSSNNNSEYAMEYGTDYTDLLEKNDTVFVYALNSTEINYTVELVSTVLINAIADVVYPVGSIYISLDNRNPQDIWGGGWEQIKEKFLIGCSDAGGTYMNGRTGGNETVSLTESQMPRHTHLQNSHNHTQNSHNHSQNSHNHSTSTDRKFLALGKNDNWMYTGARTMSYSKGSYYYPYSDKNTNGLTEPANTAGAVAVNNAQTATNKPETATNQYTGGTGSGQSKGNGSPVSIIPPYLAVYMWQRVL